MSRHALKECVEVVRLGIASYPSPLSPFSLDREHSLSLLRHNIFIAVGIVFQRAGFDVYSLFDLLVCLGCLGLLDNLPRRWYLIVNEVVNRITTNQNGSLS